MIFTFKLSGNPGCLQKLLNASRKTFENREPRIVSTYSGHLITFRETRKVSQAVFLETFEQIY